MFAAVTANDLKAVIRRIVKDAKGGDIAAAKLLLDRVLGRVPVDCLEFIIRASNDEYDPNEAYL